MKVYKTKDGIIFKVRVQPKSSKNEVCGLYQDALKIKLTAPPAEGKANKALLEFIADCLRIKKSQVEIVAGHTGRLKTIKVIGNKENLVKKIRNSLATNGHE